MATPAASIVVLNFHGGDLVLRSVASALGQDLPGVEVLVVDNGSTDGSVAAIRRSFPGVRVIENGANLGFARGMNVGIQATRGELVVPLNCDAVLHPSFVRRARQALDQHAEAGAIAPLVVRVDPMAAAAWPTGDGRHGTSPPRWLDGGPIDLMPHLSVVVATDLAHGRHCFKPNGAAPVLRRRALDAVVDQFGVGPFDPVFDTYGEDIDLAFKLWALGWSTWYAPDVVAGHVRSYASRARVFDKRGRLRVLLLASRHVNAWRHLRVRDLAITAPAVVAGDIVLALRGVLHGDRSAVVDVVRAWRRAWGQRGQVAAFRRRHPPPAVHPPGVFVWTSPRRRRHQVPPDLVPA